MVMFPVLRIAIILVMAGTFVTAGLLLPLASLMFIQSAEAATTTPPVQSCYFGFTATIVGTNNDDVIRGTEGNDVIVGLNGD
jgi:RTX calcium-binding nonapeptide repeat (4 copies)